MDVIIKPDDPACGVAVGDTFDRAAVAAAVEGPVTASCPASVLQLHSHVTVVVDEAAASSLANADFYRYVYENRPG